MSEGNKELFSFEDMSRYPLPGVTQPSSFTFIEEGKALLFLQPNADRKQELWQMDCTTGEQNCLVGVPSFGITEKNLTKAEELRRQRQRTRMTGITRYIYNTPTKTLLSPMNSNIYILKENELDVLVENGINPKFSNDGKSIAFIRDNEVFWFDIATQTCQQITFAPEGSQKKNGVAEYIAEEEFDRMDGFWISPCDSLIAFCEVDESMVPEYTINHLCSEEMESEVHRFPFAGKENASVRLGVVSVSTKDVTWMDLSYNGDEEMKELYIARVFWWGDASNHFLGAELINREQSRLDLVRFRNGIPEIVFTERSSFWVNSKSKFNFFELSNGEFIWLSEKSGFFHLYRISADGETCVALTSGEWQVDALKHVDEENNEIYFTGRKNLPSETHFYRASLDGNVDSIEQITSQAGVHSICVNKETKTFIDSFSSLVSPPVVRLRSLDNGAIVHQLFQSKDKRVDCFQLQPPSIVSFKNRDGVTLYGTMYKPDVQQFGEGPYPTIIHVYGGPHAQLVRNHWTYTAILKLQYLRNKGYLVFMVDNQGSVGRGKEFEGKIKHNMGTVEVDDQVDGVKWLISQNLAISDRVGVFGWSYGGYMSLLCLCKAPDVFKVGVAGAPVTEWENYDTGYTERYMGTPQSNPEGYTNGSILPLASALKGKLLLVHGLIDENVLFRHSARLLKVLNANEIPYETLFLPESRHSPHLFQDRKCYHQRFISFFMENL